MSEDASRGVWWHAPLIGGIMTMTAGVSTFIGTHWGGVSNDQLNESLKAQAHGLEQKISDLSLAVAKNSDETKRYVDEKFAAARVVVEKRKPKRTAEEPRDQ